MTCLTVYHEASPELPNKVLTDFEDISATLAEQGIGLERCQANAPIPAQAGPDAFIAGYQASIDRLMAQGGFTSVQVMCVEQDRSRQVELREQLLVERRHSHAQVFLCLTGRGLFSLHVDDYVYAILCEKNDVIWVQPGQKYWCDIGEFPRFASIVLSKKGAGASSTGDDIASRFPALED